MKTINHNKNTKSSRQENTRQTLFDISATHFWWSIYQTVVSYNSAFNSILLLHRKKDTRSLCRFNFLVEFVIMIQQNRSWLHSLSLVNVPHIKLPYIFSMRHIVSEVQNHKNTTTLRNPCCGTSVAASSIPWDGLHPMGYSPLTSWIREIWPQMMSIWPSTLLCLKLL